MSEINYFQLEQGIRILELEEALAAAQTDAKRLNEAVESGKRLHDRDRALLEKATQDLARLKSKFEELEREKKLLRSFNPEKLKRNLHEQKRKTEESKAALIKYKKRIEEARRRDQTELHKLQSTLYKLLTNEDFFAEVGCYRLMISGFHFPDDTVSDKALTRIKVLNTITSECGVVKNVTTGGEVHIPSGMDLPPEVEQRIVHEWTALNCDKSGTKTS